MSNQAGTKRCSVVAPLRGTDCKREVQGGRKIYEERGREMKREEEKGERGR